jgi:hypothetical protein
MMVGSKEPNNQAKAKRLGEGSRKASVTGAKVRVKLPILNRHDKKELSVMQQRESAVIISVNAREHFGVVRGRELKRKPLCKACHFTERKVQQITSLAN